MARKTNKTSHVLDLLTNGSSAGTSEPVSSGTAAAAPEKKADVQPLTATSAKVTVVDEGSRNDRVSQEILNKLSEELVQETPPAAQEPAPAASAAPVQNIQAEVQPAASEAPQPVSEDAEDDTTEENYHFINVMEEMLLHQDITRVMKEYGVCTCKRCVTDVRALTLTALPSKYVVTEDHSFSPVINYYENRYKTSMLTELVKACIKVRERPHHARS